MSDYGEGEVDTESKERVDGMVNETSLTVGSIAGSRANGVDRFMGAETGVNNELMDPRRGCGNLP